MAGAQRRRAVCPAPPLKGQSQVSTDENDGPAPDQTEATPPRRKRALAGERRGMTRVKALAIASRELTPEALAAIPPPAPAARIRKRHRFVMWSFALGVVLPFLLLAGYLMTFAQDQYGSEMG